MPLLPSTAFNKRLSIAHTCTHSHSSNPTSLNIYTRHYHNINITYSYLSVDCWLSMTVHRCRYHSPANRQSTHTHTHTHTHVSHDKHHMCGTARSCVWAGCGWDSPLWVGSVSIGIVSSIYISLHNSTYLSISLYIFTYLYTCIS